MLTFSPTSVLSSKYLSKAVALTIASLTLASCASVNPEELSYKSLGDSDVKAWTHEVQLSQAHVRTIAIAPIYNQTNNKFTGPSLQAWLTARLTELGYYVIPTPITNAVYHANPSLHTDFNSNYAHDAEFSNLHADAIVYVKVEKFGQEFELLNTFKRIKLRIKIIDAQHQVQYAENVNIDQQLTNKDNKVDPEKVLQGIVNAKDDQLDIKKTVSELKNIAKAYLNNIQYVNKQKTANNKEYTFKLAKEVVKPANIAHPTAGTPKFNSMRGLLFGPLSARYLTDYQLNPVNYDINPLQAPALLQAAGLQDSQLRKVPVLTIPGK